MEDWVEQLHQFGKLNDVRTRNMRDKVEKYVNMARWEKMNINPDVVRIKAEVKETSKRKFRIERPDRKKRAKVARDEKRSSALETVVPIGEAGIRGGFELNLEERRSGRTQIENIDFYNS
jgi:predicted  nucleic acid-binding Zn-ribbon protein